ncbi:hypothetical protein GGX14DRAFT_360064, partial [Mycena pura]
WAEPATYPGLPAVTITSPRLPWATVAHASDGACVVVGDVLRAIHQALSIRITDEKAEGKMRRSARGESDRRETEQKWQCQQECECAPGVVIMTRLAFLEGKTKFFGLSRSPMGYDVWVVNFASGSL